MSSCDQTRCGPRPARGGNEDVGAGDQPLRRRLPCRDETHVSTEPLCDPQVGRAADPDRGLPVAAELEPPERAQEEAQRAVLLLEAEGDPPAVAPLLTRELRPPLLDVVVGAGIDALIGAGEEALHQLLGGAAARGPGIEAAEED